MAKYVEILRDNLEEHAAVQAWRATAPEPVAPEMVAVLKGWKRHHKSGVYRLAGVGPGGSPGRRSRKRCSSPRADSRATACWRSVS